MKSVSYTTSKGSEVEVSMVERGSDLPLFTIKALGKVFEGSYYSTLEDGREILSSSGGKCKLLIEGELASFIESEFRPLQKEFKFRQMLESFQIPLRLEADVKAAMEAAKATGEKVEFYRSAREMTYNEKNSGNRGESIATVVFYATPEGSIYRENNYHH